MTNLTAKPLPASADHAPLSIRNRTGAGVRSMITCSCGWEPRKASEAASTMHNSHMAHRRHLRLPPADYTATVFGEGPWAGWTWDEWYEVHGGQNLDAHTGQPMRGVTTMTDNTSPAPLNEPQVQAILHAISREVHAGGQWPEFSDLTIAELCSANQDAVIDDMHGDSGMTESEIAAALPSARAQVAIYDDLLSTNRVSELPDAETENPRHD